MSEPMKTLTAWAIMEGDALAIFDERCPVYWIRRVAKDAADEKSIDYRLVRVEIRPAPIRRTVGTRG